MIDEVYYYQRLPDSQAKALYWEMRDSIVSGNVSGSFDLKQHQADGNTVRAALNAGSALRLDRPDFFFLGHRHSAELNGTRLNLSFQTDYTPKQIAWITRRVDRYLRDLERAVMSPTAWETERKVYELIAKRYTYKNNHEPHDHNIVAPLLTKSAVCEGYTSMMMLALRKVGIPCIRVSGTSRGENHCWNIAWVDGRPCHLDVTWDSPVAGKVAYRYFNLTDAEIQLDHNITTPGTPICSSGANSFFSRTGAEFDSAVSAGQYIIRELKLSKRVVRFRLRSRDSVEQCIRSALRRSPCGSYQILHDERFHSGTIIRD